MASIYQMSRLSLHFVPFDVNSYIDAQTNVACWKSKTEGNQAKASKGVESNEELHIKNLFLFVFL